MKKANKESVLSPIQPEVDLSAKREAEIIPTAIELIARIAGREDILIGDSVTLNIDQLAEYYQNVYRQEVVPTLLSHNIELSAVKYLFEMILVPIERFQNAFNASDKDPESIVLAKRIFTILSQHTDYPFGSFDEPKVAQYYQNIWDTEIKPLIQEAKYGTVSYLFELLRQPFQCLSDLTISSLEMNKELADGMKWGKPVQNIRLKDLDEALKAGQEKPADAGDVDKSDSKKKK